LPKALQSPLAAIPAVQELMAQTLKNSPDAGASRHRTESKVARIGPAGALPDPQVSLGLQRGPERMVEILGGDGADGVNAHGLHGVLPGTTEYMFSLGQEIPWPGKLAAREGVAKAGAKRSEVEAHGTSLALETDVLSGALELLVIRARQDLFKSQLDHWGAIEAIVKSRMDQGGSGASDAIWAMQELSRLRLRLLEMESREHDLRDDMNRLAVRFMGTPIDLGVDILALPLPEPPLESELLEDLKARNQEWLGASVDVQMAGASLHSAKVDRFPDFFAGASVSKMSSMPPAWKAEVGVSVPLWGGRKQGRMVAMASAEMQMVESARSALSLALAAKSRERARAWGLAFDTAGIYTLELIPMGEAALEMLVARFQNGGASFVSIVEALNALLMDHERRLDAVAQVHRMAVLQHGARL
jgi:outer membrane protein TolC